MSLLERFWTNAEMARELGVSVRTVEAHVASILHKRGYASRRDLWEDMMG